MSRKVEDLYYKLSLEDSKFKTGWVKAENTTRTGMMGIEKAAMRLGPAIAGAFSVAAITRFGKATLDAYSIQEKAERTLSAAMQQAGTYTREAYLHNLQYASSLQQITTYGDEAILGVQKMLTNFGIEGRMMDQLTKATLDLAAAKGMDLKGAADIVSKSVGSSTNALSRYGIVIEGAAGSTERAQMAVDNITKLFGGAAAAEADTYAGKITQMNNAVGDLSETIGSLLAPNVGTLATKIKEASEAMNSYLLSIKGGETAQLNEQIRQTEHTLKEIQEAKEGAVTGWLWEYLFGDEGEAALTAKLQDLKAQLVDLKEASGATSILESRRSKGAVAATAAPAEDWQHQASANLTPLDTWYFADKEAQQATVRAEQYAEMEAQEQEHWERIFAMREEHKDAEIALNEEVKARIEENERQKWNALHTISQQGGFALMTLAKGHSKAVFNLGKAVSIAEATISGYKAAVEAWEFGMKTGGPPAAAVFATLSLATTGAYIASISSQKFSARAEGGSVLAGESYVVGERGPEILTMGGRGGYIASNDDAFGSGGGDTFHVAVSIHAVDADSFERLADRNPDAITGPIIQALRRGDERLISNLRRAM